MTKNSTCGFIALMSSIIISVMLMTMVLTVSSSSFYARSDTLGRENKRKSLGLAEGCMNIALLRIAQDLLYRGGDSVDTGDGECSIASFETPLGYPKTFNIRTWAKRSSAFSNIETSITMQNAGNVTVNSWEEVATP
ncbi:MAG: hypothetical protein AAB869_02145 [Patescibacteria group bacterium]